MKTFRRLLLHATTKEMVVEVWLVLHQQAADDNLAAIKLLLEYACGKPEDLELEERIQQLEALLERQPVAGTLRVTSIRGRLARLERLTGRLRRVPSPLDAVDLLTRMELATLHGGEDVGELWRRVRERMGVEDDGSGEERVRTIRASDAGHSASDAAS